MESHEKIYTGLSILLFFSFLAVGESGIHGRHGSELIEILYVIFCLSMVVMGITISYEARKKKGVFWVLVVATIVACSYIVIKLS